MRQPAWVGEALLMCVREPTSGTRDKLAELINGRDLAPLAEAAHTHHVGSLVHARLRDLPVADSPAAALLAQGHREARQHVLRARADLLALREVMNQTGTRWLLFKGPALAAMAYREPELREYYDLDLLVPRRDFVAVVRTLRGRGYSVVRRNWLDERRNIAGEIDLVGRYGVPVDLHWDLNYHDRMRRRFRVDVDALFTRKREVSIAGAAFPVMDATDTLINLAFHAFREGGARLSWLKDIDQSTRNDPPDWRALVERSQEWGVALVVAVMLDRTRRLLTTPVPEEVTSALEPSRAWVSVVTAADRLSRVERTSARRSFSTLVARSTRAGVVGSLASLGRNTLRSTLEFARLRREVPREERRSAPKDQPSTALEEFLAAIAQG